MPQPKTARRDRSARLNFDGSIAERRLLFAAADAAGLNFSAWARSTLLAAARAMFADSRQHPTLYTAPATPEPTPAGRAQAHPELAPTAPPTVDTKRPPAAGVDTKPAVDTKPTRSERPPRPWHPYDNPHPEKPKDPSDSDGLDDPAAIAVPGLGTARFQ